MGRKVEVDVTCRLVVFVEDNVSIETVVDEMDYDFLADSAWATIVGTEIRAFNVVDAGTRTDEVAQAYDSALRHTRGSI